MPCTCSHPSAEDCKALFHLTLAKEFSDFRYMRIHRLTVDAYSLQHPDIHTKSAKSFAAHLTGMCCAMEFGNDQRLMRFLRLWLNGRKELEKPAMLDRLGELTIFHIAGAEDAAEHTRLVSEWAADVWRAYETYHALARDWIETAKSEAEGK